METINLKMSLGATGVGTTVTVALDQQTIWTGDPGSEPVHISHAITDDEADHTLTITLSGKTEQHTVVNDQGEIVEDLLISAKDFSLDGIDISQLVWEKSQYRHSFNGSQPEIVDQFFGDMGCNGQVEFRFSTPVYIWLLENT